MGRTDLIILFLLLVILVVSFTIVPLAAKIILAFLAFYLILTIGRENNNSSIFSNLLGRNSTKENDSVCIGNAKNEICGKVIDLKSIRADKVDRTMLGPEFLRHENIGAEDLLYNPRDLTPYDIENFADPLEESEQVKNIVEFENQPYEIVSQYTHAEDILGKHDTEPHDIDEQLAFKQRDRGYKNYYALNGISSAQRNAFDRYLRGELDENEARVWYSAEADASNDL